MSDTVRDRMFRAMEEHGLGWIDNGKPTAHCWCGYQPQRLGESWHMHVADALIVALPELTEPVSSNSYADHFCRGGCDCSCCYGMADEPCHCRDTVCNCGGDRAAHGQKPLEDK